MNLNLFVHTGDADIKRMLAEHGIVIQRPEPPNDMGMIRVHDGGVIWLVMRFLVPGDDGYLAYGCPDSTPEADVLVLHRMIIDALNESAAAKGKDAFADFKIVELKPEIN
jgi:hypothetical protein